MGNTESGNEAPRQGPHTNLFFGVCQQVLYQYLMRNLIL